MKAQGYLNHWRAEANKLPVPTMEGEWCVSPEGVRFRVSLLYSELGGRITTLFWELCSPAGVGLGLLFRETFVP